MNILFISNQTASALSTHSQVLKYTHARIPEKNCIGALSTATAAHSAAIDYNDQLLIEDTYYYTCDIFKSLHSIN